MIPWSHICNYHIFLFDGYLLNPNGGMMKSTKIARLAVIGAIVFVAIALDTVFKTFFAFQPAIVTMLCITTICLLVSLKEGVFACFVFGLLSTVRGLWMGGLTSFWTSFANPFIAIIPRVLIAFVVKFSRIGFSKFIKNDYLSDCLSSALGVLSNTVFCALMMIFFKAVTGYASDIIEKVIIPFFSINCAIEVAVCAIVTPLLLKGMKRTPYFKED